MRELWVHFIWISWLVQLQESRHAYKTLPFFQFDISWPQARKQKEFIFPHEKYFKTLKGMVTGILGI